MSWITTTNGSAIGTNDIPVCRPDEYATTMREKLASGNRLAGLFGIKAPAGRITVYCIFADDDNSLLHVTSFLFPDKGGTLESLSPDYPGFYNFERELYEDTEIEPVGHPLLSPLRKIFLKDGKREKSECVPLSHIEGEEVHEVGVGPIHAGIIEPGHFRFSCIGETVMNLEIHLGYQHRGIERLLCDDTSGKRRMRIAESIAGDTVAGHGTAYAQVAESLASIEVPEAALVIRGIALELERAAIHTGDLAALSGDIAYLPGNAVFGATRTILINTFLDICGSRFGRSLICEGGVRFGLDGQLKKRVIKNLKLAARRIELAAKVLFSSPSVLSRFDSTGIVSAEDAKSILLTGPAARASGLGLDVRSDHPAGIYRQHPFHKLTLNTGDVFARAYIRYAEIVRSLEFIEELVELLPEGNLRAEYHGPNMSDRFVVSLVEGWRGEIAHCAITGKDGTIVSYKIKDPSFTNWRGLELAVRGNGISDFPLCNKSFNLSYCGFDL